MNDTRRCICIYREQKSNKFILSIEVRKPQKVTFKHIKKEAFGSSNELFARCGCSISLRTTRKAETNDPELSPAKLDTVDHCCPIQQEFGVEYSFRVISKMIHRQGLSYTKPLYTLAAVNQENNEFHRISVPNIKNNMKVVNEYSIGKNRDGVGHYTNH